MQLLIFVEKIFNFLFDSARFILNGLRIKSSVFCLLTFYSFLYVCKFEIGCFSPGIRYKRSGRCLAFTPNANLSTFNQEAEKTRPPGN